MVKSPLTFSLNSPPLSLWSLLRKPCTKYISLAPFSLHCYVYFQKFAASEKAKKHHSKKRYTYTLCLSRSLTFCSCLPGRSSADRFFYTYMSWDRFVSKIYAKVFILHDHLRDFSLRKFSITIIASLVKFLITPRLVAFESLLTAAMQILTNISRSKGSQKSQWTDSQWTNIKICNFVSFLLSAKIMWTFKYLS